MKTGYLVIKNFLYMMFSNAVSRVFSLVTVIYLANILGPDYFGRLNWAFVFVSYFAVIGEFGLSPIASRDIAQARENPNNIISRTISIKLVFSVLAFVLCAASLLFLSKEKDMKILIFLYSFTIFSSVTFFLAWVFQGFEQMKSLSYSLILQAIVYFSVILGFVKIPRDYILVPVYLIIAQLAAVIFQFYRLKSVSSDFFYSFSLKDFKKEVLNAYPLAISHFITIFSQNSPLFIIGLFSTNSAVGFFAASQKISLLIWEAVCNYSNVLFPAMSRKFAEDREKFEKIVNYSIKLSFVFLLPALTSIAALSYSITRFVYGDAFIESYWTLKILIFLPLFMFLDSIMTNILLIANRQKRSMYIKAPISAFVFVLSVFAVKKMGINAVALLFSFSFILSFYVQYLFARDIFKIDWDKCVLRPILYSVVSGAIVFYVKDYSMNFAFVFAALFYGVMVYYFKVFDSYELDYIKSNIKTIKSRIFNLGF